MHRRIIILEQAAEEAIEAAAWYEQERPGLGIEFNHAINAALDLLEQDIVPARQFAENHRCEWSQKACT